MKQIGTIKKDWGLTSLGWRTCILLAWVFDTLFWAAVLAPWIFWVIDYFLPGWVPFHRVLNRLLMLSAMAHGLLVYFGLWGKSWKEVGLSWSSLRWREVGGDFFLGLGTLFFLAGCFLWFGSTVWAPDDGVWVRLPGFLFTALMVAVVEETVFRGIWFHSVAERGRTSRTLLWMVILSAVFSAGHFIKVSPIGAQEVTAWSGLVLLGNGLISISMNQETMMYFLGLMMVGMVLSARVLGQGHLWGAIGLHAGWVLGLKIAERFTDPADVSIWAGGNHGTGLIPLSILLILWLILIIPRTNDRASDIAS